VVWRCHVGIDTPNDHAREAWRFLRGYLTDADAWIFSREQFVWEDLDPGRVHVIAPTIDAFSPKNQDLDDDTVAAILAAAGLIDAPAPDPAPSFERQDGARGRVERRASLVEAQRLRPGERYVLQVSRCRGGAEEPRRGLRAHRRRGDVEGPPRGGEPDR
jgi:trehalose synthase